MSYNLLIVDDSRTVKAVVAKALKLSGLSLGMLFNAGNGCEGLEVLRREMVDLVFADIHMPVMSGVQMIEEMQADPNLRNVPVVVISTEGSTTRIEALKEKGVRGFLRKPFAPEDLKKMVESVLGVSHG